MNHTPLTLQAPIGSSYFCIRVALKLAHRLAAVCILGALCPS